MKQSLETLELKVENIVIHEKAVDFKGNGKLNQ